MAQQHSARVAAAAQASQLTCVAAEQALELVNVGQRRSPGLVVLRGAVLQSAAPGTENGGRCAGRPEGGVEAATVCLVLMPLSSSPPPHSQQQVQEMADAPLPSLGKGVGILDQPSQV